MVIYDAFHVPTNDKQQGDGMIIIWVRLLISALYIGITFAHFQMYANENNCKELGKNS